MENAGQMIGAARPPAKAKKTGRFFVKTQLNQTVALAALC
jgi:hypothetical protein